MRSPRLAMAVVLALTGLTVRAAIDSALARLLRRGRCVGYAAGDSYSSGETAGNAGARTRKTCGPLAATLAQRRGCSVPMPAFTACTGHYIARSGTGKGLACGVATKEQGTPLTPRRSEEPRPSRAKAETNVATNPGGAL